MEREKAENPRGNILYKKGHWIPNDSSHSSIQIPNVYHSLEPS